MQGAVGLSQGWLRTGGLLTTHLGQEKEEADAPRGVVCEITPPAPMHPGWTFGELAAQVPLPAWGLLSQQD